MRIFITGITGYIGSHLARSLLPEHSVFGLARAPFRTDYLADIQNQITLYPYHGHAEDLMAGLQDCRPDLVFHLAAHYTGAHDFTAMTALLDANITLGAYLLEAMVQCGCSHLIYAASVMENYQNQAYAPVNLYAATKQAFEDLLRYYSDQELVRAGGIVLSDTYGPEDRRPKILNLIHQAARTQTPIDLSDGLQEYAAVYIDDVTRAFRMAGEQLVAGSWKNQKFQVLPDTVYSLRDTVEKMLHVCGHAADTRWGKRPANGPQIQKTIRLYPPVPGWQPEVSLVDGLKRAFDQ